MGRAFRGPSATAADDIVTKSVLDLAVGKVIVWSGSAWPTLSASGLTGYSGVITWDSSADVTAPVPSEMRTQDNWLQAASAAWARKRITNYIAVPGGTAPTAIGMAAPTATGTATAAAIAATNVHTKQNRIEYAVTTASTSAVAGWRETTATHFVNAGFQRVYRFGPSRGVASNATRRFFAGFSSVTTAPTDAQPSGVADVVGVGADSTDTNLQFMHRTGSGTVVKSDTGFAKASSDNTEFYELFITCLPGATTINMTLRRLSDGATVNYTTTTAIPAGTTLLASRVWTSVGGTSSVVGISLSEEYCEVEP